MNTETFNQNFEIDRAAKVPRASEKNLPPEPVVSMTADGKPWSHGPTYYFYDGEKIRSSEHLRRIDAEHLGSMSLRVIAINKLRLSRDDAIADAQADCLAQIDALRAKITEFESQKMPKNRSLKAFLMAR